MLVKQEGISLLLSPPAWQVPEGIRLRLQFRASKTADHSLYNLWQFNIGNYLAFPELDKWVNDDVVSLEVGSVPRTKQRAR